jgi:Fic family protein
LDVLQLMQRLRDHGTRAPVPPQQNAAGGTNIQFHVQVEEKQSDGTTQRRIQVRFDSQPARPTGPVVILIAPPPAQQDPQLLQEALKFNAFSVLSEPVDVNLALEVMARAMKRCFSGNWPT